MPVSSARSTAHVRERQHLEQARPTDRIHLPRKLTCQRYLARPICSQCEGKRTVEGFDVEQGHLDLLHDGLEADGLAIAGRLRDQSPGSRRGLFGWTHTHKDQPPLPRHLEPLVRLLRLEKGPVVVLNALFELVLEHNVVP